MAFWVYLLSYKFWMKLWTRYCFLSLKNCVFPHSKIFLVIFAKIAIQLRNCATAFYELYNKKILSFYYYIVSWNNERYLPKCFLKQFYYINWSFLSVFEAYFSDIGSTFHSENGIFAQTSKVKSISNVLRYTIRYQAEMFWKKYLRP